jgi:hypothetical protein
VNKKPFIFGAIVVAVLVTSLPSQEVNAQTGKQCYAAALPAKGHGGNSWGFTIGEAREGAMNACRKYAQQTGGNPNTCKITESHCKK